MGMKNENKSTVSEIKVSGAVVTTPTLLTLDCSPEQRDHEMKAIEPPIVAKRNRTAKSGFKQTVSKAK